MTPGHPPDALHSFILPFPLPSPPLPSLSPSDSHFIPTTLAIRFLFASSPMHLLAPPLLSPDICAMRGVGTTSWFLLPISTAVRTLNSSLER